MDTLNIINNTYNANSNCMTVLQFNEVTLMLIWGQIEVMLQYSVLHCTN